MAIWYRQGAVAVTSGSSTVVGTATGWTSQVKEGDGITFDAGASWYEVASVASNTALTLATSYAGSTASGLAYAIDRRSPRWTLTSDLAQQVADLLARITKPLSGAGVPTGSLGVDGDIYFDTTGARLYGPKAGGAWGAGLLIATGGREVLGADRTYYVSQTGSDANNGLSAGTPFATIAKAVSTITDTIDIAGRTVTIQLADGSYGSGPVFAKAWSGGGAVVIRGNATTPANVVVGGTYGLLVQAPLPGVLTIQDMKISVSASGIYHQSTGTIKFANINFGACGSFHISTEAPGAKVEAVGNYTISGGAQIHWLANGQGMIVVAGRTITLTGTPAFSSMFAYATRLSQIQGYANTFIGGATGTRYYADGNSLIFSNGGGASAYPGNSAGATTTGGQYV